MEFHLGVFIFASVVAPWLRGSFQTISFLGITLRPAALTIWNIRLQHVSSAEQPKHSAATQLQTLIDEQRAAVETGDPASVATASQKLILLARQQIEDASRALSRPQLTAAQKKQLEIHRQQLRQILSGSLNDWGTAEARQQQYGQALEHFQQAEKWDASTQGLMRNLGTAAFRLENYTESGRALDVVVDAAPEDQSARLMLAMSLFSLERFSEAAQQFSHIEALALQDTRTAYAWAYSLTRSNQPQRANEIADGLATRDLPPEVHLLVCKLYTASENYEHALPCLKKISEQNPSMPNVHYETGATLVHMGRSVEAIPELKEELAINADDVDAKYYLAYAFLETSHRSEAIAQLQALIAEQPQYSQAQYQLGKAMLEDDKINEAIEHLEVAEKLDSSSEYVHYQLQIAYRRTGRMEDANRELQIYKDIKAKRRNAGTAHERISR